MKILLATQNRNKVKEIAELLDERFQLLDLNDFPVNEDLPETGDTFAANALQKARYVFDKFGIPTIADDSGIEADALNGAPGIYSARYAGEEKDPEKNMNKLLNEMAVHSNKTARFRCAMAFISEQGEYVFEGKIEGKIILERRGNGGFGYDPVFIPEGYDLTFSELSSEVKNKISHRAIAMQKLVNFLTH